MSTAPLPEDAYVRNLCLQCGHAFVWHGIGAGHPSDPELYVPEGCGVRGCTCECVEPEEA